MSTKIKGEAIKEGSIPLSALKEMPYAYPVEFYEGEAREFKVVELGGEKLYNYLGEISIPSDVGEVEGTLLADAVPTEYYYQSTYEGVLQQYFESKQYDNCLNLYIGNDKHGYSSLKIEPSEDPNNLKWFDAMYLGMLQEYPGHISFAFDDTNRTLYYKAFYVMPCNIKVYWLCRAQKLDVNLIPDTFLKTTPQTLSDTDKNQALANLGIDPVVWKYMCNPLVLYTGKKIPDELLTNDGNLKYLYPNIYRIEPSSDDFGFSNTFHSDSSAQFIPKDVDENYLICKFPTYKNGEACPTEIDVTITNGVVESISVIAE